MTVDTVFFGDGGRRKLEPVPPQVIEASLRLYQDTSADKFDEFAEYWETTGNAAEGAESFGTPLLAAIHLEQPAMVPLLLAPGNVDLTEKHNGVALQLASRAEDKPGNRDLMAWVKARADADPEFLKAVYLSTYHVS